MGTLRANVSSFFSSDPMRWYQNGGIETEEEEEEEEDDDDDDDD